MKQLGKKALHAVYNIRQVQTTSQPTQCNQKLAIRIFGTIISPPILLYNSEVWGAHIRNDFNNWDNSQIET
jgi:hypothetical protein